MHDVWYVTCHVLAIMHVTIEEPVDQAAYDAAVQSVLGFVAQRYAFLQTTGPLSQ